MLIFLASTLTLLAVFLLWQARKHKSAIGLPAGRIIYADTGQWGPVEEPLYDPELGITGRPDYLIHQKGEFIPVEVKSSRVSSAPYDSHVFQLAAYCLLVERLYGKRPSYGVLHYPNRTFAIDFTAELEQALLDLIEEMRAEERRKEIHRSHQSVERCKGCGYRNICEQRLK